MAVAINGAHKVCGLCGQLRKTPGEPSQERKSGTLPAKFIANYETAEPDYLRLSLLI